MIDESSSSPLRASGESHGLVRRIAASFRPCTVRVTLLVLLILITAGLGVVNPVLIRVVFDSALLPPAGSPDLNLLWLLGAIMASTTIVSGGLGIVQTYLTNQVGQSSSRADASRVAVKTGSY